MADSSGHAEGPYRRKDLVHGGATGCVDVLDVDRYMNGRVRTDY